LPAKNTACTEIPARVGTSLFFHVVLLQAFITVSIAFVAHPGAPSSSCKLVSRREYAFALRSSKRRRLSTELNFFSYSHTVFASCGILRSGTLKWWQSFAEASGCVQDLRFCHQ
jgi:hypothetical protein